LDENELDETKIRIEGAATRTRTRASFSSTVDQQRQLDGGETAFADERRTTELVCRQLLSPRVEHAPPVVRTQIDLLTHRDSRSN
jgi:hypothetical protein